VQPHQRVVTAHGTALEILDLAPLQPQLAGLVDADRGALGRVHAAGDFALGLDQPCRGGLPGWKGLEVPRLVLVVIVGDPGDLLFAVGRDTHPLPYCCHVSLQRINILPARE
jgi:hypothetical protein